MLLFITELFQKLHESIRGWLNFSDYSPTQKFAIVCGLMDFYLLGLILDWDWCLPNTSRPRMRWLAGQSRKTQRIAMGCVAVLIIFCIGFLTFGRSN